MKIAVILLNYMAYRETLREISLLKPVLEGYDAEIVVVDNASCDESGRVLRECATGKYTFIQAKENRGYAAGNNIGLRYAKEQGAKYAWVLNSDILFPDVNILKKMLRIFAMRQDVAAVSPDVYSPEGYLYNREAIRPTWVDMTFGMFRYRKKGRGIQKAKKGWLYVYRMQGCCFLADLEKLENCGFLDENTFLYYEEPILAERLLRNGYRCVCCSRTRVIHNHSVSVVKSIGKSGYRKNYRKSYSYYIEEYRKFSLWQQWLCKLFFAVKVFFL